jgi:predicted nucleotidyltransferase
VATVADLTLDLVRAAAADVAAAHGLDLVVLFGSAARDGFARAGDVDLGVRAARPVDWLPLHDALARRLGTGDVDVVDVGRASPLLLAHVARDGVPLYERVPGAFAEFRADAVRRFDDTRHEREALRADVTRRLRELSPAAPDLRPWGAGG